MRYILAAFAALLAVPAPAADFPAFKMQEIDTGLKIGYAVITVDIDGDKKPDIVVVDQHKVVWYQNPGKPGAAWKKFTILDGKTRPDNVCVAAIDITGDGKPELVLGAAWKPFDTSNAAQLVWLKRGKDVTKEWTMHELPCDEPMVHRVRVADIDGDGKPEIIMAPLMGRDATAKGNWMDGRPVKIIAYKVPAKEPEKKANWKPVVINYELHVVHNFTTIRTRSATHFCMPVTTGSSRVTSGATDSKLSGFTPRIRLTRRAVAVRARSKRRAASEAETPSQPSSRGTQSSSGIHPKGG